MTSPPRISSEERKSRDLAQLGMPSRSVGNHERPTELQHREKATVLRSSRRLLRRSVASVTCEELFHTRSTQRPIPPPVDPDPLPPVVPPALPAPDVLPAPIPDPMLEPALPLVPLPEVERPGVGVPLGAPPVVPAVPPVIEPVDEPAVDPLPPVDPLEPPPIDPPGPPALPVCA